MVQVMTEKPDIVARLRAYTRNNSPVLASDLKEAADEIASLRSLLTTEPASLIAFARRVSEQIGHAFDPHKNISSVWTAVGDVRRERDALCSEVDLLRKSVAIADDRSRQMVEFVRLVSEAAGRPTPDAFDPPALVHLVEAIRTVRRERDELTPSWVDDAESSAPVYRYLDDHLKPKALTLDDLDRQHRPLHR